MWHFDGHYTTPRKETYMKKLEKKVHFTCEGTSIGCYDSNGSPMRYLLIDGEPHISLDNSVDRLLDIGDVAVHDSGLKFYQNHGSSLFGRVFLKGVINGTFIGANNSRWRYAERECTHRELASFHLAMYKAHKNTIKLLEAKNG